MLHSLNVLFNGTNWIVSLSDGSIVLTRPDLLAAIVEMQSLLPDNPDGSPAIVSV